ncbi:MAG TPA: peptidyl-prolyl cis-trans isomerase [Gaiellaceae bacterium]|nr:peptidyl-prolyl cis-trans isomerase [Gaiellaceae bacterium]
MTRRLALLALLPALLVACGGSGGTKSVPADAVALVGDQPISRAAFASLLAATRQTARLKGQPFPTIGTASFRAARNKLLDQLVLEAQLEQHAKQQFGIVIGDDQIDRQVEQLRTRISGGSEASFEAALARQGTTEAQVRSRLKTRLLGEAVLAQLSTRTAVSDAEVERWYEQHRKGYEQPATRRVRHILVPSRAQADELERKLHAGADFAALARRYSIDAATATKGGALPGATVQGQTLPAFDRVAFSLKTNAVSAPVHTTSGWHIIQATSDVTPTTITPLSDVRPVIEGALLSAKRQQALPRWERETRAEYAKRVLYARGYGPAT